MNIRGGCLIVYTKRSPMTLAYRFIDYMLINLGVRFFRRSRRVARPYS